MCCTLIWLAMLRFVYGSQCIILPDMSTSTAPARVQSFSREFRLELLILLNSAGNLCYPCVHLMGLAQYLSHLKQAIMSWDWSSLLLQLQTFLATNSLSISRIFRKCITCCRFRRWHALHTFMEAFQGQYKDGTNSTCDFRIVSALYLIFRIAVLLRFLGKLHSLFCIYQNKGTAMQLEQLGYW